MEFRSDSVRNVASLSTQDLLPETEIGIVVRVASMVLWIQLMAKVSGDRPKKREKTEVGMKHLMATSG